MPSAIVIAQSIAKVLAPTELTERMVAHMALDTPCSLAWVATSSSYILACHVVYKSTTR